VEAAVCRIGLLGFGRVGQAVAALAASSNQLGDRGIDARVVTALVRDPGKPRSGARVPLGTSVRGFFDRPLDLAIEVMGGVDPAYACVRQALESGIPVVTANKSLMAAKGEELRAAAARAGVALAYDAAVLAGVPFIGALARRPFAGAPDRITGILNGTSHFLACALAAGRSFDDALAEAIERGYAEPDCSADVSGRDAAEKLTILAHLAGCRHLVPGDLPVFGIDAVHAADFDVARALGATIKPIASASFDPGNPGAWVGPALVDVNHPAASSRGVHNFVELREGDRAPVTFAGPGAGPDVTARTILDDVAEILAGAWRAPAIGGRSAARPADLRQPPAGAWYLRARHASFGVEDFAEHLAVHRVPALRLVSVGGAIAARTTPAPWHTVRAAADVLTSGGADVLLLPVMDATEANDERR
jgi:homoserine dehydrogenase